MKPLCFLYALPLIALGCTSSAPMQSWIGQQGGVVVDAHQTRASAVSAGLLACCHGRDITISVLASDDLSAYGWPDGHIFVSVGLVDRLNDDELAAAIAHELGHLISDGQLQTVASLSGRSSDPDREIRADSAGIALLHTAGLPPTAMVQMLQVVKASPSLSSESRLAIEHRIKRLPAEIASLGP